MKRIYALIQGRVQGVGFRFFARDAAQECGVTGWVRNRTDGGVEAEAQGEDAAIECFVSRIKQGPPLSHVDSVDTKNVQLQDSENYFSITH
jgi:acylphosphatase